MARRYENFDVEVVRRDDGYIARVRSPRGEAQVAFARPLSDQELRILGLSIARGRKTTRSVQTREVDEVKAYGQRLFDAVFTGDVLACYHDNVAHVRGDMGTGLRVRLRLAGAPELAQVPWEYLFDRRSNRFLALDEETPIVRYLDLPLPAGALVVEPPLRILVMIASPSDVPGLDADLEWSQLQTALADLTADGAVELHRLERATISALRWQLKKDDYHVFHFIGHGGVDAITDCGVLLLEDDAGRSDAVEAEVVAGVLAGERTLRLVVLNACEGGRASKGDIFAGTAQSLVQQDVPAVIAMQFEISDQAAIALTHDFYKAVALGDPVDAALTEARRGLRYQLRNELEWGTPVLYMRASDGRLFDVRRRAAAQPAPDESPAAATSHSKSERRSTPSAEPDPSSKSDPSSRSDPSSKSTTTPPDPGPRDRPRDRRIDELLHAAQLAAFAEKWQEAESKLEQVLELDPGNAEAQARLADARRDEQFAVLYRTAADHEAAGRTDAAIESYERVRKLVGSNFRGIDEHIRALRDAKKAQRKPRQLLWIRIGKFAVGIWALGLLAMWIAPDESTTFTTEPSPAQPDVLVPEPVQPQDNNVPGIAERAVQGTPPLPADLLPQPAPVVNAAPDRDAEAALLGLSRHGEPMLGTLAHGTEITWDVHLDGGTTVVIAGSCDAACSDLDLLISEQGIVRFQDVAVDAQPVLMTPVLVTGVYQLTVRMPGCGAPSCGYRVQIYR